MSILVLFFEIPGKYQEYMLDFEISPRIMYKVGFSSKVETGFVHWAIFGLTPAYICYCFTKLFRKST
jgi:hypothetical protein